jgi:small ligand-binding sensory domain FIST
MTSQAEKGKLFRALHERGSAFIIPNPWDIGSARLLAHLGFEALATTSMGYAFSLGKRDGALDALSPSRSRSPPARRIICTGARISRTPSSGCRPFKKPALMFSTPPVSSARTTLPQSSAPWIAQ